MNYYPFHLGDYAAHTGHLEPMEDLAYRRLLDVYYMREGALPADIQVTAKLVRLRSCAADVESVLNEFFVLTEDGWRHQRCEHEIAKMQDKQAKARASAQASVNSRRAKAERSLDETPTNVERQLPVSQADVELPTPTPTPTPKNKEEAQAPLPDWLPIEAWNGYVEMRKRIRKQMTPRAQKLVLDSLGDMMGRGVNICAALDNSTRNNWTDVYEPKPGANGHVGKQRGLVL